MVSYASRQVTAAGAVIDDGQDLDIHDFGRRDYPCAVAPGADSGVNLALAIAVAKNCQAITTLNGEGCLASVPTGRPR